MYEPLIGIQCPMLCSRMGDTWQIGDTSIREDHLVASDPRFVHWCHASPMCTQDTTQRTILPCECVFSSKTNLPKQELTPTTSWPLQPPEKQRICATTSPLPTKGLRRDCSQSCRCQRQALHRYPVNLPLARGATWIMTRSASHVQMWHTAEPPTSPS